MEADLLVQQCINKGFVSSVVFVLSNNNNANLDTTPSLTLVDVILQPDKTLTTQHISLDKPISTRIISEGDMKVALHELSHHTFLTDITMNAFNVSSLIFIIINYN